MAITRWVPYREVVSLQNRFNTLFRDMQESESPLTTAAFVPRPMSLALTSGRDLP